MFGLEGHDRGRTIGIAFLLRVTRTLRITTEVAIPRHAITVMLRTNGRATIPPPCPSKSSNALTGTAPPSSWRSVPTPQEPPRSSSCAVHPSTGLGGSAARRFATGSRADAGLSGSAGGVGDGGAVEGRSRGEGVAVMSGSYQDNLHGSAPSKNCTVSGRMRSDNGDERMRTPPWPEIWRGRERREPKNRPALSASG